MITSLPVAVFLFFLLWIWEGLVLPPYLVLLSGVFGLSVYLLVLWWKRSYGRRFLTIRQLTSLRALMDANPDMAASYGLDRIDDFTTITLAEASVAIDLIRSGKSRSFPDG